MFDSVLKLFQDHLYIKVKKCIKLHKISKNIKTTCPLRSLLGCSLDSFYDKFESNFILKGERFRKSTNKNNPCKLLCDTPDSFTYCILFMEKSDIFLLEINSRIIDYRTENRKISSPTL